MFHDLTNQSQGTAIELTETQLKALVPARAKDVIAAFRNHGPMTIHQLQQVLDFASKSLYYQVRKLTNVGLIVEGGAADGQRKNAAVYRLAADRFVIPDGFQGAEYEHLAAEGAAATLRRTIRRIRATAEASADRPELVDSLFLITSSLRLTPQQAKELARRQEALFAEYAAQQTPEVPPVEIVVSITPQVG